MKGRGIVVPQPLLLDPSGQPVSSAQLQAEAQMSEFDRRLRSGGFGQEFSETLSRAMRERDEEKAKSRAAADARTTNCLTPLMDDIQDQDRHKKAGRVYSFGRSHK